MPRRDSATTAPQLSCELCSQRKVKCDKEDPCSNCVAAGEECIPIFRNRLPRGRHAPKNRSAKPSDSAPLSPAAAPTVNGMVGKSRSRQAHKPAASSGARAVGHAAPIAEEPVSNNSMAPPAPLPPTPTASEAEHPANVFWTETFQEIHGIRDARHSSEAVGHDDHDTSSTTSASSTDDALAFLGLGLSNSTPSAPTALATLPIKKLCQVYLLQVDPIIKILHRASISKHMQQGEQYLGYPHAHVAVVVLDAAVCYAAAGSMSENQVRGLFCTSKLMLLHQCRSVCEHALHRSNLLATRDITIVQAFVLYLVGRRLEDNTSAVWTLMALVVRLGKGLGLDRDPEHEGERERSFFDQQMRKRLWLTICLIDLQASFAQATQPLIDHQEVRAAITVLENIDDADFGPATLASDVAGKEGLADTTFALTTYHAQLSGRLLNFALNGNATTSAQSKDGVDPSRERELRQEVVDRFEHDALKLLHFCDPESSRRAWFTWHSTQCLVASMRIASIRPFDSARAPVSASASREQSDPELLRLVMRVLDKANLIHTDRRGEGFRWYVKIPWHALAIAIAQCRVCDDLALVQEAWPLVEAAYKIHESDHSRQSREDLQGPLSKLMQQTRERVGAAAMSIRKGAGRSEGAVGEIDLALLSPESLPRSMPPSGAAATAVMQAPALGPGSSAVPSVSQDAPFQASQDIFAMDWAGSTEPTDGSTTLALDSSMSAWNDWINSTSFEDLANPNLFAGQDMFNGVL